MFLPQVKAILAEGIPFLGIWDLLPQRVLEEGGYHIKGKKESEQHASWTTLKRSLPPATIRGGARTRLRPGGADPHPAPSHPHDWH